VIIAQYGEEDKLLNVRIYWDNASLLKQLGVFELAFHNMIKATGQLASFSAAMESLNIADGHQIAMRLINPTPMNASTLYPLDLFRESLQQSKPSHSFATNYAPRKTCNAFISFLVGGLDNLKELGRELPGLNQAKIEQHLKAPPALKSSIFDQDIEETRSMRRSEPAPFASDEDAQKQRHPASSFVTKSIFGMEGDERPIHRPGISLDPTRNSSTVFKEPTSPFQPSMPLTDRSRFDSHIFQDSPMKVDRDGSTGQRANLQASHFFGDSEFEETRRVNTQQKVALPFGTDSDEQQHSQGRQSSQAQMTSMAGHFHGCSFKQSESVPSQSLCKGASDGRSNRSSFQLGDNSDEARVDLPRFNERAAFSNKSQLQMGDNVPPELAKISSRVLQPPGGRSTIFSD